ncbi:hypothetical protein [Rhodococcus sp. 1168]|uniref:hypothetical protein n=1 Tax=Rhodococcus sp. 1168 TaxID=2018041 RepID=UPI000F73B9D3|nr:hypothetical protein [Rhodococcus sp. 1168]
MSDWVMAEYRSLCLVDDPPTDAAYPEGTADEDVDDYLPPPDPPEGFDLLTAAPGIVTITTGAMRGRVHLTIQLRDDEPQELAPGKWDTVEEIGFRALSAHTRAASGEYYPFAAAESRSFAASVTPQGPGFYRVRAYETNRALTSGEHRDEADLPTEEKYLIQIWPLLAENAVRQRLLGPQPTLLQ